MSEPETRRDPGGVSDLAGARARRDDDAVARARDESGIPDAVADWLFPALPVWLRVCLWFVAVVNVLIGVPLILGVVPGDVVSDSHAARDGALACFFGIVAVMAALMPRYTRPLAVISGVLFALQVVTGFADIAVRGLRPVVELVHLLGLGTFVFVAIAAYTTRPRLRRR